MASEAAQVPEIVETGFTKPEQFVVEVNEAGFPGQMVEPSTPVGGGDNTVKLVKLVPEAVALDTTIGPEVAVAGKVTCMVELFTTL
jgi:hypothetical protein